jgi:hypothetical protein
MLLNEDFEPHRNIENIGLKIKHETGNTKLQTSNKIIHLNEKPA